MADRYFNQFFYSLEKKPVFLWAEATIAGSGAPTLVAGRYKGITSITRSSTGLYVITFSDVYVRMLGYSANCIAATGVPAAPIHFEVSNTTSSATIQFNAASGSSGALQAADPGSGETLRFQFVLSNSSAI